MRQVVTVVVCLAIAPALAPTRALAQDPDLVSVGPYPATLMFRPTDAPVCPPANTRGIYYDTSAGTLHAIEGGTCSITDLEAAGGGGGAATNEPFVTYSATGGLSNERVLTSGTNTTVDTSVAGQVKVNLSGTHADAFHTDAYSGVGSCGANEVVTTLNDNAGPTCASVTVFEAAYESAIDLQDLQGAVTDAQVPNNITIDQAASLSANPADCAPNQYAHTIAASGNLTCSSISDADVPNNITIDLAAAATALAANGSNCLGGQAAAGVDASGNAEGCFAPTAAAHDLLDGATHPDTAAGTPDLGDIIVGNASNKWEILSGVGVASGDVLTMQSGAPAWVTPITRHIVLTVPVAVAVNATYVTVFTVTPTASKTNHLAFKVFHAASSNAIGMQFRVRSADAGNVGNCAFTHYGINATATSNVGTFSAVIAIGSNPADTASLASFVTTLNRVDIDCAFTSDGTPGDVILEAQLETGTTSTNILAGSSYTYISN